MQGHSGDWRSCWETRTIEQTRVSIPWSAAFMCVFQITDIMVIVFLPTNSFDCVRVKSSHADTTTWTACHLACYRAWSVHSEQSEVVWWASTASAGSCIHSSSFTLVFLHIKQFYVCTRGINELKLGQKFWAVSQPCPIADRSEARILRRTHPVQHRFRREWDV